MEVYKSKKNNLLSIYDFFYQYENENDYKKYTREIFKDVLNDIFNCYKENEYEESPKKVGFYKGPFALSNMLFENKNSELFRVNLLSKEFEPIYFNECLKYIELGYFINYEIVVRKFKNYIFFIDKINFI